MENKSIPVEKFQSNALFVSGITDYLGPTSHEVISMLIKGDKDRELAFDSIASNQNSEFNFQLRLPSFSSYLASMKWNL